MLKRWLKILLKVLPLLFVFLLVFLLCERWRGQFSLARYKNELAARGVTLDVHALMAPPIPEVDNGASEVLRLMALMHGGKVLTKNLPPRMKLVAPGKAMVGFREHFWVAENITNTWAAAGLDLAANKQILEQLRVALAKPAFDFKLDHSQGAEMRLPQLAQAKSLCQWLVPAFQNSLRNGENQSAFENLIAAISLPRLLENDRLVISELVRIAISSINLGTTWEALQADVWTDEQLALMQKAWEENTFATNMVRSLEVERADGDSCFERFRESNDETYQYMFPPWLAFLTAEANPDASSWWRQEFFRKQIYCRVWRFAWIYQDEKFYLEGVQQLVDGNRTGAEKTARLAEEDWFGFAKAPRQNFYNDWRFGMGAQSLASLSLAMVKSARAETDRSMVLCAIALKRYLLRHGKPAPDLNALVPEFLPSVPMDYMDGKPMKYRLNPDGNWRLYSVGGDGLDGDGDPSPAQPGQGYRWIWRGKDVVWPAPASPQEIAAFVAAFEAGEAKQ